MPSGIEPLPMEIEEAVQKYRWREGDGGFVVMDDTPIIFPVNASHFVEVLQLVLTQSGIAFKRQQRTNVPSSSQLHSHTIGVLDVCGQGFPNFAQLACLHELVGIVHIIKVRA